MPIYATIKTNLRVRDVATYFRGESGWQVLQEIDSVNYGEGYDLQYQSVKVRLYDSDRTEAVLVHPRVKSHENYQEIFVEAKKECAGRLFLYFEIDRCDESSPELQKKAFLSISIIVKNHGLLAVKCEV